jgi:hypothetical protein
VPNPKTPRKQSQELVPSGLAGAELALPVLLPGEDRAAFDRLLAQVEHAVGPRDIIEAFWVRDVVDLVWDTIRLRRLKESLLAASSHEGLRALLHPLIEDPLDAEEPDGDAGEFYDARSLAEQWNLRNPEAVAEVNELLGRAGLTMDSVMAKTLDRNLKSVERIERLIADTEMRRAAVLREIDRHREALATRLRRAAQEIEDAEFAEVPPQRSSLRAA